MADTPKISPEQEGRNTYIGPSGRPIAIDPGVDQPISNLSGLQPISKAGAVQLEREFQDQKRVEREYGSAGAFGMGLLGGGGLFKAGAIHLAEALGDRDVADGLRRDYQALESTYPGYSFAGDAAGLVGMSALTGGFGGAAAEGLIAGGARVGGAGVARALATNAAKTAVARSSSLFRGLAGTATSWGMEGGAANLMHTIGQSAIHNVPLTWEQAASSYGGGFLFGSALGAGGHAIGAAGKALIGVGARGMSKEAVGNMVLREMGATPEGVARITAQDGGVDKFILHHNNMMKDFGKKAIGSSPKEVYEISTQTIKNSTKQVDDLLGELSSKAGKHAPQGVSLQTEAESLIKSFDGLPEQRAVSEAINSQFPIKNTGNWKLFYSNREKAMTSVYDALTLRGVSPTKAAVTAERWGAALDRELTSALKEAEAAVPGLEGIESKFAGAEGMRRTSTTIREFAEKKAFDPGVGPESWKDVSRIHDFGVVAAGLASGHPLVGALYAVGKTIGRNLEGNVKNALFNKAVDMHFTSNVVKNAAQAKAKVESGVARFFTGPLLKQTANAASRKLYETNFDAASRLVGERHQARVKQITDQLNASNPGLGDQAMASYLKAKSILERNMVGSRSTDSLVNLRRKALPAALDAAEHKFLRIWKAMNNPLSIIDDLNSGRLSRDAVQTVKELAPALYGKIVETAADHIATMKSKGKSLSVEKVTHLGILLDAPIDPMLRKEYIDEVQASFEMKRPEPGRPSKAETAQDQEEMTASQEIES